MQGEVNQEESEQDEVDRNSIVAVCIKLILRPLHN